MEKHQRIAIGFGVLGLILIILGIKFTPVFLVYANQQSVTRGQPVVLFFTVDDPCECMTELILRADEQISNWHPEQRYGISTLRIAMDQRNDLEAKYKVFRAPCLILVDAQGHVVWRQDYPLIDGGPFKLDELEATIAGMGAR